MRLAKARTWAWLIGAYTATAHGGRLRRLLFGKIGSDGIAAEFRRLGTRQFAIALLVIGFVATMSMVRGTTSFRYKGSEDDWDADATNPSKPGNSQMSPLEAAM